MTKIRANVIAAARNSLEQSYPFYVDAHRWATQAARSANDHRAIAPLTTPILDRVAPKREGAPISTSVNIILTNAQQHALESLDEADYEILEAEVLQPPTRGERHTND